MFINDILNSNSNSNCVDLYNLPLIIKSAVCRLDFQTVHPGVSGYGLFKL